MKQISYKSTSARLWIAYYWCNSDTNEIELSDIWLRLYLNEHSFTVFNPYCHTFALSSINIRRLLMLLIKNQRLQLCEWADKKVNDKYKYTDNSNTINSHAAVLLSHGAALWIIVIIQLSVYHTWLPETSDNRVLYQTANETNYI